MSGYNNSILYDNRPVVKFNTAEEAWLWFCFCEITPLDRSAKQRGWIRPCETSDIAITIKRLVLNKILNQEHLKVLSRYGLKQIPPHENSGDSARDCTIWKQALQIILKPLQLKGIVTVKNKEAI